MDSSNRANARPPQLAGSKRPAPEPLLPAFEPIPSSPALPRPFKRAAFLSPRERNATIHHYPTPLPTSSTAILSSSPPRPLQARPELKRTRSTVSERAPLSTVPSITLPEDGEPVLMGRSRNSSHYQLSANRLISRVHIRAAYIPGLEERVARVEVVCMGWNGVKVHCQDRAWDLRKGDSFSSETVQDIMIDVQDARVLVEWPSKHRKGSLSDHSQLSSFEAASPGKVIRSPTDSALASSPIGRRHCLQSPVSPTPARSANFLSSTSGLALELVSNTNSVSVYEDVQVVEDEKCASEEVQVSQQTQVFSQPLGGTQESCPSSALSDPEEFSDRDEENDPFIVSFTAQGENLLPRMASVTTGDSIAGRLRRRPEATETSPGQRPPSEAAAKADTKVIANHIINQLAFSRLSSTPLSIILNNLPAELRKENASREESRMLSAAELETVLQTVACIGSVRREGKDAAGKPLESEYYYIPDTDTDTVRKNTVVEGLRKPGLRACRKQHKQYYWRRPKTP